MAIKQGLEYRLSNQTYNADAANTKQAELRQVVKDLEYELEDEKQKIIEISSDMTNQYKRMLEKKEVEIRYH